MSNNKTYKIFKVIKYPKLQNIQSYKIFKVTKYLKLQNVQSYRMYKITRCSQFSKNVKIIACLITT